MRSALTGAAVTGRRALPRLTAHWPFLVLLGLGAAVRALAFAAYHPALLFNGDSYTYIAISQRLQPAESRPIGYPLLLRGLSVFGHLAVVPLLQHLLGLAIGTALYVFLLHRRAPRWLAMLAAAPVLLDAYQIDIEQFVLSETMFAALLLAALMLLLWWESPPVWACAVAGLLLSAAILTRTVALAVAVLVIGYALARRCGLRRLGCLAAAILLPLTAYAGWFDATRGRFALESFDGRFLWGRVMPFADCAALRLPADERVLCGPEAGNPKHGPNDYLYGGESALRRLRAVPSATVDDRAGDVALRAIEKQPAAYAQAVIGDVVHYFAPGRWVGVRDWPNGTWEFPQSARPISWHVNAADVGLTGQRLRGRDSTSPVVGWLSGYQRFVYTPGPLLLGCLLVAVVAAVGYPRRRGWRTRADCLLLAVAGLSLLVLPAATTSFDYRYLLPTLVVLPPAAALGFLQLRRQTHDHPDHRRLPVTVAPAR